MIWLTVEVRPQCRQFLLLGEHIDPFLQLVVRGAQAGGLGLVARRAVGAGEDVQQRQLVTGVTDIAPDSRVGPLPLSVPVEPQVQLDQFRDAFDDSF